MFDPHLTAAEWYLGSLGSEGLPEFARMALELGYDGKNLAQPAALVKPTKQDVNALIGGAFRELAVTFPLTQDEAAVWRKTDDGGRLGRTPHRTAFKEGSRRNTPRHSGWDTGFDLVSRDNKDCGPCALLHPST
jgi:hypothetical protein